MDFYGLDELIKRALAEDIGHGDITTMSLVPEEQTGEGIFYAKGEGILAGTGICRQVFAFLDPQIEVQTFKNDGEAVVPGDKIMTVKGQMRALLSGERVALNFMQRMSGIASKTRYIGELVKYLKAELVDTRKTTPGLRLLEKYAVRVGGGRNHRFALYDGVMIKDNHIQAVGGIQKAVCLARQKLPHTFKIEVEVESLEQLQEALEAQADIIMLDNMDVDTMKAAVEIVAGRALLEASGGVNEENIVEIAKTGVDFISCGALTHSATSLDISFKIS
ncbi:MAG: carboxylating nicotinate-nucleotide diphosphorylase [Syntrophomonadaceae bacterium]|nr:carboxylating nicotinate-nucleotide diphosphorylase [Syntrophomonadaceae bacterium]